MRSLLACLGLCLLAPLAVGAQDATQILDSASVAERFLWGPGVTVGIALSASFLTPEARAEALDLRQPLGSFEGHDLRLGDVLLDLSLDGLGFDASWRIIGPGPIVEPYLLRLRHLATVHQGVHSMSSRRFGVVCACD